MKVPKRSVRSIRPISAQIILGAVLFILFVGLYAPDLMFIGPRYILYIQSNNVPETRKISRAEYPKAHPACKGSQHQMETYDATELLHETLPEGFEGACMFNPAILRYKNDVFLWIFRAYHSRGAKKICHGMNSLKYGAWSHGWDDWSLKATQFMITALIEHDPTTGQPLKVLYSKPHFHKDADMRNMKLDGRLFIDNKGNIQLLHNSVYLEGQEWIKDSVTISQVDIFTGGNVVAENLADKQQESKHMIGIKDEFDYSDVDIILGPSRLLPLIIDQLGINNDGTGYEKNWVPFNSTTLMSYPVYPKFSPHIVIKWKDFSMPLKKYESTVDVPFLDGFQKFWKGSSITFSGGTPMIEEAKGTWLGIGHAAGNADNWHKTVDGEEAKVTASIVENFEGQPEPHLLKDYFAFFYRVEKKPPYRWTHISKAFKTPLFPMADGTRYVNNGVVYPMNIEKLGSDKYMISYGEDDALLRIGVMPKSRIEESLMPISSKKDVKKALKEFEFCTYRLEGEEMR